MRVTRAMVRLSSKSSACSITCNMSKELIGEEDRRPVVGIFEPLCRVIQPGIAHAQPSRARGGRLPGRWRGTRTRTYVRTDTGRCHVTDRLLDARATAERLGVPESWVRESARSGAIPHVRRGRYVGFDLADVEAWLQECKQPARAIRLRSHGAERAAGAGTR
jgi:excisionase family DNA binding protein